MQALATYPSCRRSQKKCYHVVFICSGNQVTGFGHVSRCLNIAHGMANLVLSEQICFYGDYGFFSKQRINEAGFTWINEIPTDCLTDFLFIIDDYQMTAITLEGYRNLGAKLVVIDDFNQFGFECIDLIINFRFEAEKLYPLADKHLLGLQYFPVAPSFEQVRKNRLEHRVKQIRSVLVFIGGSDRKNFAPRYYI